ncbi:MULTISPECIES: phytanoyl-CoA dioxygenase family protein [unclassified Pseudomonas]|uniref:phytanoyl-CoA dioxygenase family protein n=1 Tax=unclassified Pseudomonas TaxID=196821 RepID=UPI0035C1ED4A
MNDPHLLHRDGYILLREATPGDWLPALRGAFDDGVLANSQWPVPRGAGWRHAALDLAPQVQALCRLPALLAAAGELIGERFFLSQVEGREPLPGHGHQALHRDLCGQRPGDTALAIIFLDDYGPANGATRLVPGSHRHDASTPDTDIDEARSMCMSGLAGDILVFDADLVHAASLNASGARRRSLLVSYCGEKLHALHVQTASLRHVRMDLSERFDPPSSTAL